MKQLFQLQAQLIVKPPPPSIDPNLIAVKLISVCGANAHLRHAKLIFSLLPEPNLHVWNALLKVHAQNNSFLYTIHLFNLLLSCPGAPVPDEFTFTSVIKSCSSLLSVTEGYKVHAYVIKLGVQDNLFIQNSLIDMYFKFEEKDVARKLFDKMPLRDVVSWNTLLNGYSVCGDIGMARKVFDEMSERSLVSWSAMVAAYARVGDVNSAREVFDKMRERNVVSWNSMIACYAHNTKFSECVNLFYQMQQVGCVAPNDVTLVSVLSACGHLGALDLGKWIDKYVKKSKMELNLFLGNALSDMYAKCGAIEEAKRVFHAMNERDVITWSIVVNGLAMHGYSDEAFMYFSRMVENNVKPNEVTFMGLISACTHAGLVDKGLEYFNIMNEVYEISPTIEHYGCIVDLLSRAGRLDEAENMINEMPVTPNVVVWGSLLGGCRTYKDVDRGERVVQQILELDSDHSGSYVYLAYVYALMGRLDDAAKCRLKMRENKVTSTPGCSWIEVNNTVHEFFRGDRSHPETDKIYSKIRELGLEMKLAGYTPNTDLVSHSIDDEEKEDVLSTHSEKLAIAFGLISTNEGTTIRVVKNLRVCTDCHEAVKVISRIVRREIILRDRSRFHMFKAGRCSCNDYW
ncbi:pentatricopeptide repeat-containing protein At1g08070, chloroplastic-like [Aristolochia californica]|uniref:pentatricopeptide repeat-containing protein At1g08070, chloroplastic-like n=1 Tax=Aristolochia californica TaxID=171875 RepID=UPI0035E1B2CB